MDVRREPVFESEARKAAPTLAEFARSSQITEDKVWDLIEEGQVSARFVNEAILIMQDQPTVSMPTSLDTLVKEPDFSMEPSAPWSEPAPSPKIPTFAEKFQPFKLPENRSNSMQGVDFSEDSTELLTFAQDALSRTAELSKELLATKNELIRLKDERIAFLSDLVRQKDKEIRSLNRNIEELATLSNFETR